MSRTCVPWHPLIFWGKGASNGHDVLFFLGEDVVHFFVVVVSDFLHFGFGVFRSVFGQAVFHHLFECVDGIAAGVADADFGVFTDAFGLFDEFLAALFGERRHVDADDFTVVVGIESEVGVHDGLLDGGEHGFFPRLHGDGAGVGDGDVRHLGKRCGGTVVVHQHIVQDFGIGFASPYLSQFVFKMGDCVLHELFGFVHVHFHFFVHILCVFVCGFIVRANIGKKMN